MNTKKTFKLAFLLSVIPSLLFANNPGNKNSKFNNSIGMKTNVAAMMSTTGGDTDPPNVIGLLPATGSVGTSAANPIIILSDELLAKATGNIFIVDDTDGTSSETIDVASSSVIINGNNVIIHPSGFLDANASYSVSSDEGAFTDIAGNELVTTTLTFTTGSLNVWNGSTWSTGFSPVGTESICVQENQTLIINSNLTVLSLDLENGSTIQVEDGFELIINQITFNDGTITGMPGGTIELNGELYNKGTFTLESGSSIITFENKSIIGNSLNIKRNPTFTSTVGRYSIFGTPIDDASTSSLGSLIYKYDEAQTFGSNDGLARFITVASGETMIPAKGYFSAFTGEVIFSGKPNTGTIEIATTFTDRSDANDGYNLIANPYGASIDFTDFIDANGSSGLNILDEETIWIWEDGGSDGSRRSSADYVAVNSIGISGGSGLTSKSWNDHITSMQGFFVKVDQNANITFNQDMRVRGNNEDASFFRSNELPKFRVYLEKENASIFSETLIGFRADAEIGYDKKYDASKILTNNDIQLYTKLNERKLAIQGLPLDMDNQTLDLRYNISEEGTYLLSLQDITGLPEGTRIYIIDNESNEQFELTQNQAFRFNAISGKNQSKYSLAINPSTVTSISNSLESLEMVVFKNNSNHVQIRFTGEQVKTAAIEIYSISGKNVLKNSLIDAFNNEIIINEDMSDGIYIIRARANNAEYIKKIIYKK